MRDICTNGTNIKKNFKQIVFWHGLGSSIHSEYGAMAGSCVHDEGLLSFRKGRKCSYQLSDYEQQQKKVFTVFGIVETPLQKYFRANVV